MLTSFSVRVPASLVGMGSSRNAGDLVKELGASNALIVTDANVVKAGLLTNLTSSLDKAACKYDIFDGCQPGATSSTIEKCCRMVRNGRYDLIIGVGGGSTMDSAKAISVIAPNNISFADFVANAPVNKVMPKILVPTTSGTGSEWSRTGVYYDDATGKRELIQRDYLFANGAVIDPELTMKLPAKITADVGIDALTHAIEAYISPKASLVSEAFSESAIKLIAANLRLAYARGSESPEARYNMALAASMGMGAAVTASSGMVHIMNSPVVNRTQITHGEACILLLPHSLRFNLITCPEKLARIAAMMGEKTDHLSIMDSAQKAVEAVVRLAADVGMPDSLARIGITEADIPVMAKNVFETRIKMIIANNPRQVTLQDVTDIYTKAM